MFRLLFMFQYNKIRNILEFLEGPDYIFAAVGYHLKSIGIHHLKWCLFGFI